MNASQCSGHVQRFVFLYGRFNTWNNILNIYVELHMDIITKIGIDFSGSVTCVQVSGGEVKGANEAAIREAINKHKWSHFVFEITMLCYMYTLLYATCPHLSTSLQLSDAFWNINPQSQFQGCAWVCWKLKIMQVELGSCVQFNKKIRRNVFKMLTK